MGVSSFSFVASLDPEAAAVTSVDKCHGAKPDALSTSFCWCINDPVSTRVAGLKGSARYR